jgi:adenine-specific DNA methylase
METFATDRDRLAFLLETEAELAFEASLQTTGELEAGRETPRAPSAAAEAPPADRPKYVTNYIGSKQKLVDWIWKNTPDGTASALDAFSGSAVVAYMYKTKGLRVVANDRLRLCHHTARAIVENSSETLSPEEIDALLAENPKAGTFVRENFDGLFFEPGVHAVIDQVRANIEALSSFKKDIGLFVLAKTCMSGGFGHFTSTGPSGNRKGGPDEFRAKLRSNAEKINALIFDNGEKCLAFREEIAELLPKVKVDLAYFDPPYATEFSTTNYEKAYHFVEGLMTNWEGLSLIPGSKTRSYETDHQTVTKGNARTFFEGFLSQAKHIRSWLISYRDKAYPTDEEMKGLITSQGMEPRLETHDHHYMVGGSRSDSSDATEYLFVCQRGKAKPEAAAKAEEARAKRRPIRSRGGIGRWEETPDAIVYVLEETDQFAPESLVTEVFDAATGVQVVVGRPLDEPPGETEDPVLQSIVFPLSEDWTLDRAKEWLAENDPLAVATRKPKRAHATVEPKAANLHTSFAVDLVLPGDPLAAQASAAMLPGEDPKFTFILCRVGTNRNGDQFLPEELTARHPTAVNKKIDLKHSQDFTDIVGGIAAADYIEDEAGARVECVGELYVRDSAHALLAHKLIRKGIISQVSMECDYEEGECSACGKRVTSKAEYCLHLKKYKGTEFQGQIVSEILHGVTFTGVGLLDRKGADENARITQVADVTSGTAEPISIRSEGEEPMTQPNTTPPETPPCAGAAAPPSDAAKKTVPPGGVPPAQTPPDGGGGDSDPAARVKQLESENKQLRQKLLDLQKQVDELLAAQKTAANRSRAGKLLKSLERRGLFAFENDEEREQELGRLAGLSDEAFAATEAAFQKIPSKDAEPKKPEGDSAPATAAASKTPPLRAAAAVRPHDVDDAGEPTLEEQLKSGLLAAYRQRVGMEAPANPS